MSAWLRSAAQCSALDTCAIRYVVLNALEMLPHAYAAADPCPVEHIASALRVIAEDKKVPAADSIIYSQSTRESTIDEGPEGYR